MSRAQVRVSLMLKSERKKFIFVHIYKNAGSSITSALLPFASSFFARNMCAISRKFGPVFSFDSKPYRSHIAASEIVDKIGYEKFRSYFSFAIVRNPWDWQVSLYNYMLRTPEHHQHLLVKNLRDFSSYVKWRCESEVRLQKDFICSRDGGLLVDFVGRYENLNNDFSEICGKIGVSATLPKLNVTKNKPYSQYYDDESRELVERAFSQDIALFGYRFHEN